MIQDAGVGAGLGAKPVREVPTCPAAQAPAPTPHLASCILHLVSCVARYYFFTGFTCMKLHRLPIPPTISTHPCILSTLTPSRFMGT